jgi:predicted ABC-type ATPase
MSKIEPVQTSALVLDGIVESFFKNKKPFSPYFIVTYGPPGSGKTSIVRRFLQQEGLKMEQTIWTLVDDVVAALPEFQVKMTELVENAKITSKESKHPVDDLDTLSKNEAALNKKKSDLYQKYRPTGDVGSNQIMNRALASRFNIIYETTGASVGWTIGILENAIRHGYRIVVLYPFVPRSTLETRLQHRSSTTLQAQAPSSFIDYAFTNAQNNISQLSHHVDQIIIYNNGPETKEGQEPEMVLNWNRVIDSSKGGVYFETSCPRCDNGVYRLANDQLKNWMVSECKNCSAEYATKLKENTGFRSVYSIAKTNQKTCTHSKQPVGRKK